MLRKCLTDRHQGVVVRGRVHNGYMITIFISPTGLRYSQIRPIGRK
jgi:hypothetical protein